jgi:hypothetical protein
MARHSSGQKVLLARLAYGQVSNLSVRWALRVGDNTRPSTIRLRPARVTSSKLPAATMLIHRLNPKPFIIKTKQPYP